MKKITFIISALCLGFMSHAQLPESFDTGIPAGWATFIGVNGEGPTHSWQSYATGETNYPSGGDGAVVGCRYENGITGVSEDWLVTPLVSVIASASLLSFDSTDRFTPDYGSAYSVRVSTASQTTHADFTTVFSFGEGDVTAETFQNFTVDLSAYIGSDVYIAFVLTQNDSDFMYLDNVDLITDPSYTGLPESFDTGIPGNWATFIGTNGEGPTHSWQSYATGETNYPTGGDGAVVGCRYENGLGADSEDWLVTHLISVTAGAPILSFDSTDRFTQAYGSDYSVRVSTASQTTHADFTTVFSYGEGDVTAETFQNFTVDLSAYIGSDIYIAFVLTQNDSDFMYLDNVDLVAPLSVPDFNQNSFSHFYNKDTKVLNLESSASLISGVEIYSILGKKTISQSASSASITIDMSSLNDGIYLAKVNINGTFKTIKFVKN